jgi:hypothetical protein
VHTLKKKKTVEQNHQRLEQTRLEREQVLQQIEAAQRVEAIERARKEIVAQAYRNSLAAQMEQVEEKRREEKRMNDMEADAEKVRRRFFFSIH